jgi:protein-disulfide isomerase
VIPRRIAVFGLIAGSSAVNAAAAAPPGPDIPDEPGLNGTERDEVMEMIKGYILGNPEVMAKAFAMYGALPTDGNVDHLLARATPASRAAFADLSAGSAVNLAGGGPVILIAAIDYACPFCRTVSPRLAALTRRNRSVSLYIRDTPILGPDSDTAARVGIALSGQGEAVYRAFHYALMERQGPLTEQAIFRAARASGADMGKAAAVITSQATADKAAVNITLLKAMGILATPMLECNGLLANGSLEEGDLDRMVATRSPG